MISLVDLSLDRLGLPAHRKAFWNARIQSVFPRNISEALSTYSNLKESSWVGKLLYLASLTQARQEDMPYMDDYISDSPDWISKTTARRMIDSIKLPEGESVLGTGGTRLVFWPDSKDAQVILNERPDGGVVYVRRGSTYMSTLCSSVWDNGHTLSVKLESSVLRFDRLTETHPPIGKQFTMLREWVAKRKGPGAIFLVGPTGAGKTSLSLSILPEKAKVLSVAAEDLSWAIDVVTWLQPDVLLIDDVQLDPRDLNRPVARALSQLAQEDVLVVVTQMADDIEPTSAEDPGALYLPGIRPGRIDKVVYLYAPSHAERMEILEFYGCDPSICRPLADLTTGLTGAFLEVLAGTPSGSDLERTVKLLRAQAPAGMSSIPSDVPEGPVDLVGPKDSKPDPRKGLEKRIEGRLASGVRSFDALCRSLPADRHEEVAAMLEASSKFRLQDGFVWHAL